MSKNQIKLIFVLLVFINIPNIYAQTIIEKNNGNWELIVDGKPYMVKGVTFGFDKNIANYDAYFKDLKFLGVNTIRTWATGENTPKLLAFAHKNGIKVMLGIWMRHGRPGMEDDDRFNYLENTQGKEDMFQNALDVVEKYKNHPAVLTWGIGNEVYLNTATDEEKMAYSKLLERICSAIKQKDSSHPITSVEAWTFGLDWWQKYVPSLDIYGLNSYGPGANLLADELDKKGIDKPYILTEFGITGEWDIKQEISGVKVEPNDHQKYDAILNGYNNWIKNKPANLGVFVFHYASGQDFIAPWLFTHYNNMTRPQYWAIREAYTANKPINHVPEIKSFNLPKDTVSSGSWVSVDLDIADIENDVLQVRFSYNQRTGSRKRRDQINALQFRGNITNSFQIQLPKEDGPIKVYVFVKDTYNNVGIASTGIVVKDKDAKKRKYLVPKVNLPFYVYKDVENEPYTASAFMGNYKVMTVDSQHKSDKHSGKAALKISYNQEYDWYGLGLVNPANDWGDILGGYDVSGAKRFSFWAKSSKNNVVATIGFGLIGKDKPYPDTAKKSKEIKLSTKWEKYSFSVKKLDLSCIRSGLTIFSSSYRSRQDIFIDDVVFE
ncbi:MAG: glycoside hydrolase family 2 TIM barrel-domain containing protein [Algibacter sp.]|uniref:glycoside hydrolase family 2 TIM barrel-domain containing protein n=1 Tax=Algibacter sp. TaxID=1872428 RepID=UPI0026315C6C|nr:glycoside hydrolase family 2 TIM barrel-domain containing protein [Algibacter sp.]MDG1728808.1 glycoside hydrolase family 2 TIM barrel-domain containing protein [Algibacter sp.]MDG2177281.1 glycoside hydrolase family 2 TIM barrel-domain containing protein [Algibacter sp.]